MPDWIKILKAVQSTKYSNRWDIFGDANLNKQNLTKLPLQFGVVTGGFFCSNNNLKTLEGSPIEVGESFYCYCNELKSLEGSPIEVGGEFNCSYNNLETLEGAPIEVGGDFFCSFNKLKSLEDAPREVGHNFYCNDNQLESLEGLPKYINGNLYTTYNPLEHLNDLLNVQIKGGIICGGEVNTLIKALHNTNLDTLEYTLNNHTYRFTNDETEKEFYMHLEQIIVKKRLEKLLRV